MSVRIPVYNQQVQTPGTALQGGHYDAPAVSPIGDALQQVGHDAQGVVDQVKSNKDATALLNGDTLLSQLHRQVLYGDPDHPGTLKQDGTNASGITKASMDAIDKGVSGITPKFLTREAAAQWQRSVAVRREDSFNLVSNHEEQQGQVVEKGIFNAALNEYRDTATNDPSSFPAQQARARLAIGQDAIRNGVPPEVSNQKMVDWNSKTVTLIATTMLNNSEKPQAVQDFIDNSHGISAEAQRSLTTMLRPFRQDEMGGVGATAIILHGAAGLTGAPPADYQEYRRRLESGKADGTGSTPAPTPGHMAAGPDQIIEKTWLEAVAQVKPTWAAGLSREQSLALRNDPKYSGQIAAALDASNTKTLLAAGLPVTNENIYAMYHLGPDNGLKFAAADPTTPITSIVSADQLAENPYLKKAGTKAGAVAVWQQRAGVFSGQGSPPASKGEALQIAESIPENSGRREALAKIRTYYESVSADRIDRERTLLQSIYTKVNAARGTGASLRALIAPDEFSYINGTDHVGRLEGILKPNSQETSDLAQQGYIDQMFFHAAQSDKTAHDFLSTFKPFDSKKWNLTTSQRDGYAKRLLAFNKNDPLAIAEVTDTGKIVDNAMFHAFGYMLHPKNSEADIKFNQFRATLQNYIQAFRNEPTNKGRMPTREDVQHMADTMLLQTASGHHVFEDGRGSPSNPDNPQPKSPVVVPADQATLIRIEHPNYTDEQVRRLYMQATLHGAK